MSSSNQSRSRVHRQSAKRKISDLNSNGSILSFQEREARGILIDRTRMSEYVISVTPYGLHHWVQHQNFKNARNKDECLALASIIDCLVRNREINIHTSQALEHAIRRLLGVHTADQLGKWETCEALQLSDTNSTLLPPLIFDRVIHRASQLEMIHQFKNEDNDYAETKSCNNFFDNDDQNVKHQENDDDENQDKSVDDNDHQYSHDEQNDVNDNDDIQDVEDDSSHN
jgi:hypothetical protein